mmetsp:Transcript_19753/g.26041  ORF Transcript_19753/g.26041 Transcript_19753/m.26041 type:complete len:124 (+) Transcript_19753:3-374(+)
MDEKKAVLVDALVRKSRALASLVEKGEAEVDTFKASLLEVARWEDVNQDKHARLMIARDRLEGREGAQLKLINKLLAGDGKVIPKAELHEMKAKIFAENNWEHLVEYEKKWSILSKPKAFTLF